MWCHTHYKLFLLLVLILLLSSLSHSSPTQARRLPPRTSSSLSSHPSSSSPSSPKLHISRLNNNNNNNNIPPPQKPILYNSSNSSEVSNNTVTTNKTEQIQICLDCVGFMQKNLGALVLIVEKIGVTETCDKLCGNLNSTADIKLCTAMCDAIGIASFWELFVKVDINPIYACELVNACFAGKSPAVNFTGSSISPPSGPPGTTFEFQMQFTVTSETGVGETAFVIYYPSDGDYNIGFVQQTVFPDYQPGNYQANLTFPTNSSFITGRYLIIFDLCSGACGLDPAVYPFAEEEITFNITNIG